MHGKNPFLTVFIFSIIQQIINFFLECTEQTETKTFFKWFRLNSGGENFSLHSDFTQVHVMTYIKKFPDNS